VWIWQCLEWLGCSSRTCTTTPGAPVSQNLLNQLGDAVDEMLDAAVMVNPAIRRLEGYKGVVVKARIDRSKVTLVSGGGSGHEPSHAGWVGDGMLTAAVAGPIFASPSTAEVLAAVLHCASAAGCLVIVKNYTGDRLNFGLAIEHAKAEGHRVEMVVVGDDCALASHSNGLGGRRGVAGVCFVHKVAGAAAAAGATLDQVASEARAAAEAVGTMGVALRSVSLGRAHFAERIPPGTMEVGLGIHGEAGTRTCALPMADQVVEQLLEVLTSREEGRGYLTLSRGDEIAVLVNNLGGTTMMEMAIILRATLRILQGRYGSKVRRVFCGPYTTSLDMQGVSISVFKLTADLLARLDAPADPWSPGAELSSVTSVAAPTLPAYACVHTLPTAPAGEPPQLAPEAQRALKRAIGACCRKVIELEPQLTRWDSTVGDGDCGETMKSGGLAILADLDHYPLTHVVATVQAIGCSVGKGMSGTSGALYVIGVNAAAAALGGAHLGACAPSLTQIAGAFTAGVDAIMRYGGASIGDRTMIDALQPAAEALRRSAERGASMSAAFGAAASAAEAGAEATKQMAKAGAGRSSYLPSEVLRNVPDPGAMAVACWMRALASEASL
jgi:dihydroxyacetone kinase